MVLDALGSKGVWQRTSEPVRIAEARASVIERATNEIQEDRVVKIALPQFTDKPVSQFDWECMAISDTFIVTASCRPGEPIQQQLFHQLGNHLCLLYANALREGLAFRGAISVGSFYKVAGTLLGPAVDEAAWWHDKTDWVGAILTPSAEHQLEMVYADDSKFADFFYPKWNIPFKPGVGGVNRALGWPSPPGKDDRTQRQLIADILLQPPVIDDVATKYRNTIAFWDQVMRTRYDPSTYAQLRVGRP